MDVNNKDVDGTTKVSEDSAGYQLKALDDWRLKYIATHTKADGSINDDVDPKVVLKAINDTATSLSRRQAQELATAEAASAEQYRSRALSVVEAAVSNSRGFIVDGTGGKPIIDDRCLPVLPEFDDIHDAEVSNGIVRLDPKQYGT